MTEADLKMRLCHLWGVAMHTVRGRNKWIPWDSKIRCDVFIPCGLDTKLSSQNSPCWCWLISTVSHAHSHTSHNPWKETFLEKLNVFIQSEGPTFVFCAKYVPCRQHKKTKKQIDWQIGLHAHAPAHTRDNGQSMKWNAGWKAECVMKDNGTGSVSDDRA